MIRSQFYERSTAMRPEILEEDAIRRIVHEGTCADYIDVANVVQQRFGLRVGCGRVEEIVQTMKRERPSQPVPWRHHAGSRLTSHLPHESKPDFSNQNTAPMISDALRLQRAEVLKFVESMGGFDAARAAIADLETSLNNLMN